MKVSFTLDFSSKDFDANALIIYKDFSKDLLPKKLMDEIKTLEDRETFKLTTFGMRKFHLEEKPYYICTMGKTKEEATFDDLRFLLHKLFVQVKKERYENIAVKLEPYGLCKHKSYQILSELATLSQYKFDWFKSDKKENKFEELIIIDEESDYKEHVEEGILLAEAQKSSRYLVDEPANIMTPTLLAKKAKEYGDKYGFEVDIFEESDVKKLGMKAYLAVSQGSKKNSLRLIVMRYRGAGKNDPIYGLVGKGLCYDSGGYSLKPTTGMVTMKLDMGGSAAVIGGMQAIAAAKLKVNVTAVVAACQNLIGPDAYYPGDIIDTMNGKTVFVGNTDAEGRLTLIDAITYIIKKENASTIVDFATLTGAAVAAFGNACAATLSNNDEFYKEYEKAAENAGEKIWRLPIFKEYKELIKHKEADLTNSAGSPGTITAGMFLGEFVEDKPWVHVDIAPIAFMSKPLGYYDEGATGYGAKTCYELMKARQK